MMLADKTILIVGCTAGIGEAVYCMAATRGARVIGVARNAAAGARLAKEMGGQYIQADISDDSAVTALFDRLMRSGVQLDGAVNNAAMTQDARPIDSMQLAEFDRLIGLNLRATWHCVSREVAMMRAAGGSIVNVASIAGKRGFAGLSAYCASKHGVIGLTRAAAQDGADSNIRVNAVLPGTTRTAMLDQQMATRPGGITGTLARIPIGRVSTPAEQAEAILWLLSDASSFVTGEALTVDGGTTSRC